jgi:hypothetical protein
MEQRTAHKTEKNRAKFLSGFRPNEETSMEILTTTFLRIFLNFNIQMVVILQDCRDAWDIAMRKMARYVVNRIFDGLKDMKVELEFNEKLIVTASEKMKIEDGSVTSSVISMVLWLQDIVTTVSRLD